MAIGEQAPRALYRALGISGSPLFALLSRARSFWGNLSLGTKILFLVTSTALVAVLATSFMLVSLQRQQLIANAERDVTRWHAPLRFSLEHGMMENDSELVGRVVSSVAQDMRADWVRIIDSEGVIRNSSVPGEEGTRLDLTDESCQACHTTAKDMPRDTTMVSFRNGPSIISVQLIPNQPQCITCHDAQIRTLGLVMLQVPVAELDEQLRSSLVPMSLAALIGFALVVGLLVPILRRTVTWRVKELAHGLDQVKANNFEYSVGVAGGDELSKLASAFEEMRGRLKFSHAALEKNAHEALTLYRLGQQMSSSLEFDEVSEAVAAGARQALHADAGIVGVLNPARDAIVLRAISGVSFKEWEGFRVPLSSPEVRATLVAGRPLERQSPPADLPQAARDRLSAAGLVSFLFVPLWRRQALQGVVGVCSRNARPFTRDEVRLLQRLSQQVVIAIENAQLYGQVRNVATLEERDRLAREIHDNVAQALGYLNLKASVTDDLLTRMQIEPARASLAEMKEVIQGAYVDTREAIFNLRTTIPPAPGILPILREYLAEYRAHYKVEAQLEVEDEALAVFPPETTLQVMRVIQEALANVRKHAEASRAWVRIEADGAGQTRIVVQDDGQGFDLAASASSERGHFGLIVMRERAESVGGRLRVDSAPGRGTRVEIVLPKRHEA